MIDHTGASQTRFDVDGFTAYFRVERDDRSGVYPDWDMELIRDTQHVPGSNRSVTQMSGFGLSSLTLTLWFDTREAYRVFRTFTGSTGRLTLLSNFTSHEGGDHHDLDNDYEHFTNTTLMQISGAEHHIGGHVRCEATFVRAFDPVNNLAVTP